MADITASACIWQLLLKPGHTQRLLAAEWQKIGLGVNIQSCFQSELDYILVHRIFPLKNSVYGNHNYSTIRGTQRRTKGTIVLQSIWMFICSNT